MKQSDPSTLDFESVWEQYYPRLAVFVSSLVQRVNLEWEDLVQDIMLKVYKNLHRYEPSYSFAGWFYSIARNHCIDALKKELKKFFGAEQCLRKERPGRSGP